MNEEKYVEMLEDGILYDYITNLQQENERLKETNRIFSERIISENNPDYKLRCEKAIEYIKDTIACIHDEETLDDLLNILQNGSDKE